MYTDGSVSKDQSEWDFTVKQGATTIREDSAAYTVSTSSLTMEVEAVTHALRWTAILLTDSVSLLQSEKWSTSTFENSYGCTALDMPE